MPTTLTKAAPTGDVAARRNSLPRSTALLRGLLGWTALCTALGVAIGLTLVLQQRAGLNGAVRYLVQAGLMSLLVVTTVLGLRRRFDRRSATGLGLARRATVPALIGVGAGLASAGLVWLPAALLGWVRADGLDLGTFVTFLLLNGVVLLLFEALPEELALRGYTWTNLRDGWGAVTATLITTALFPLTSGASTAVTAVVTGLLGTQRAPLQAFPDEPFVYVLQLVLFGLALAAARQLPIAGALWAAIAFHWTQLTITRALLGGLSWTPSGLQITFVEPAALTLVLVHILFGGLMLLAVVRRMNQRASRRARLETTGDARSRNY